MNTFRNAPHLWAHTCPAAAETQPADLDDAREISRTIGRSCPPCGGDCAQGRACPARLAEQSDYQRELAELDRDFRRFTHVILGIAVLVIAAMVAAHLWPGLARWLP